MERRVFLKTVALAAATQSGERQSCDVFVYGSTPGGIAAAVEAARRGCRVVLACPKNRPGGMAASGLSTTDAVRTHLFGGLVTEFVAQIFAHYRSLLKDDEAQLKLVRNGWYYERSVAEEIFRRLIEGEHARLRWLPGRWLEQAVVTDRRIREVKLTNRQGVPITIAAHTFIDATYEGDLAAAAKVSYRVGREGREEFGEPFAGIHYMNCRTGRQIMTSDAGEPSLAIQAFCGRSIFTDDPAELVPIEKPDTYEEHLPDYLPLCGDFANASKSSTWIMRRA